MVEWKGGSTDWVPLKDLKTANPLELAEYVVANNIDKELGAKLNNRYQQLNKFQQLIGTLWWAIEIERLDILTEVSCLS